MLRVSREVPGGLTGLEGGPTERLVLKMVDTTHADTVRAALLAAFAAHESTLQQATLAERLKGAELRTVPFSRAQLYDWTAYITTILLPDAKSAGIPLTSVGLDPYRVRVEVMVVTEAARTWVEARLAEAQLPCGLVETKIGGPWSA